MIPFDPLSPMDLWYLAWRGHVMDAHRYPDQQSGYCQAAVIANAEYEMATAIEKVKEKSK